MEVDDDTLSPVIRSMGLEADCALLPDAAARDVMIAIEERFLFPKVDFWTSRVREGVGLWSISDQLHAADLVRRLCPDTTCYLLPVAERGVQVFQTRTSIAIRLLERWHYEEFALIDSAISWFLMEDHHGLFLGCGDPVETRLQELLGEPDVKGGPFSRSPPQQEASA